MTETNTYTKIRLHLELHGMSWDNVTEHKLDFEELYRFKPLGMAHVVIAKDVGKKLILDIEPTEENPAYVTVWERGET